MRVFGYDFQELDDEHISDLLTLEREQAVYTDHWIGDLNDFRHIKIPFTEAEIKEYVRGAWAYELFLRAGHPEMASEVERIPADIAERADSYVMRTKNGEETTPWHCFAGFVGPEIETLICTNTDRQIILENVGIDSILNVINKAVDALTPAIRAFNHRERGLEPWPISCEDDVRDLLYVMIRSSISDLKPEESTPSRAGTYKFVDLFSASAKTLIEIKWIGKRGVWKRIIKEINDDIQSYHTHPYCKYLFFIIVDAVKDIPDPRLIESQLSGEQTINGKEIKIFAFVREP